MKTLYYSCCALGIDWEDSPFPSIHFYIIRTGKIKYFKKYLKKNTDLACIFYNKCIRKISKESFLRYFLDIYNEDSYEKLKHIKKLLDMKIYPDMSQKINVKDIEVNFTIINICDEFKEFILALWKTKFYKKYRLFDRNVLGIIKLYLN